MSVLGAPETIVAWLLYPPTQPTNHLPTQSLSFTARSPHAAPWQAQLTAKGRKWAEGLAEDEREEVGALPAVPEGEDVDSVMLSGGSRLLVGRPASPDKAPPGAGGGGAASGGGSATAAGAAAAAGGGEG